MVDALSDLLDGVRARGALFSRTILTPPWSLRMVNNAPITLATMLRDRAWIVLDGGAPVPIRTGDIAIVRGPAPYTVADDPDTEPRFVCHGGVRCSTLDGAEVEECEQQDGPAVLISGSYQVPGDVSERLLAALPPVVVVSDGDRNGHLADLVVEEITKDEPGRQVVLDRLLDLVLISTLRTWFDRPEAHAPAWYRAMGDHVVGQALRLLHDDPAQAWTVAGLAAKVGVSRAGFARRFTDLVGEPPMTYLTGWRIARAADLLRETDATVESIARKVGYANTFALSVAFKRVRGLSPSQHRTGARR